MEIILSKQCESLTGTLGRGYGYCIQKQKDKFVSKRISKGSIPNDGHLRFIFTCADLAQSKLHIADIKVTNRELFQALREAYMTSPAFLNWNNVEIFSATDVINFKNEYNL